MNIRDGGLFSSLSQAPPPLAIPEKKNVRFRVHLERNKVKNPWGRPDKKGKYQYELLWEEIKKLPEPYQERFNDTTTGLPTEIGKQYLKCFKIFMSFNDDDLKDFDESRGRL